MDTNRRKKKIDGRRAADEYFNNVLTHRSLCASMSPKGLVAAWPPDRAGRKNGSICVKLIDYGTDLFSGPFFCVEKLNSKKKWSCDEIGCFIFACSAGH